MAWPCQSQDFKGPIRDTPLRQSTCLTPLLAACRVRKVLTHHWSMTQANRNIPVPAQLCCLAQMGSNKGSLPSTSLLESASPSDLRRGNDTSVRSFSSKSRMVVARQKGENTHSENHHQYFFLQDVKSPLLNTPLPVLICNNRTWGQASSLAVINTLLQEDCY